MRKLNLILIAIVVAGIGLALYAITALEHPAPEVTFVTIKGERITTADLRGRVTLVEFWSTDCAICLKEMPEIVRLHKELNGRGFETIAVSMRYDPPNYVLHYAEKNALPFKVALDPMGELAKAFGDVTFTPTRFVIDREGNVVVRLIGAADLNGLRKMIENELKTPAKSAG
jgi:peroxiredoxin